MFGPSLGSISGSDSGIWRGKDRSPTWLLDHNPCCYQIWPRILEFLSFTKFIAKTQGFFDSSWHLHLVKHVPASQCHILQHDTRDAAVTSHVQTIQNCFWPIFTYFRQDNFLWGGSNLLARAPLPSDDAASWCSLKYLVVWNFTSFGNLETKTGKPADFPSLAWYKLYLQ